MSFEEFRDIYELAITIGIIIFAIRATTKLAVFYICMSTDKYGASDKMPPKVIDKIGVYTIAALGIYALIVVVAATASTVLIGVSLVTIVVFVLLQTPIIKANYAYRGAPAIYRWRVLAEELGYGSNLAILVENICLALMVGLGAWSMKLLGAFPPVMFWLAVVLCSAGHGACFAFNNGEQTAPWKLEHSLRLRIHQPTAKAFSDLMILGIVLPAFIVLTIANLPSIEERGQVATMFLVMVALLNIRWIAMILNNFLVGKQSD